MTTPDGITEITTDADRYHHRRVFRINDWSKVDAFREEYMRAGYTVELSVRAGEEVTLKVRR